MVKNEDDDSPEGFTTQAGFWRKPVREAPDKSPEGFTNRGRTAEKVAGDFSGTYTCGIRKLRFAYEGSWETRSGVIHWAARIRFPSAFWDARGTLFDHHPGRMASAVRHSVEQWIEAFSSGQASLR